MKGILIFGGKKPKPNQWRAFILAGLFIVTYV
jgi:hypothetical protein